MYTSDITNYYSQNIYNEVNHRNWQ